MINLQQLQKQLQQLPPQQQRQQQQQEQGHNQQNGAEEEFVDIASRVDPLIPGPLKEISVDAEGWGCIDVLSAWECTLAPFKGIEEIPMQHQEAWATAVAAVLQRIQEVEEDGPALDRALKWWLFLPQALCRQAGRGGRAGMGLIKKRFNCVVDRDFGELVTLWRKDKESALRKTHQKPPRKSEKDPMSSSRSALSLISKGHLSKAVNRITSHGVATLSDPATKAAMESKYPARSQPMPEQVIKGKAVENLKNLRDSFLGLKPGTAPGTGQLRPEYLISLAKTWREDSTHWSNLESFSLRYINAMLPPWFCKCCLTVETVG